MPIENIKGILEGNKNIHAEIKDDLLELINIFISAFPKVSLQNLEKNLSNLKIEKVSKYVTDDYAYYNGELNTLYINSSKITDNDDIKHIMMHCLLDVITYNGSFSGFNQNNFFKALNIGFTEILTNNLVGNEGDLSYLDDEVISTNLIASMIGNDVLFDSYFGNDTNKLVQALINEGVEG